MAFFSVLECLTRGSQRRQGKSSQRRRQPLYFRSVAMQSLEDRVLLSANFVVNTTLDTVDANLGDGLAEDANGMTSLRAAIMEANALAGTDTITLGNGVYMLTRSAASENVGVSGDLDITDDLVINGVGSSLTIVDARGIDRVFHIHAGAEVEISNIAITGGRAGRGGGVANEAGGNLTLSDVLVGLNTTSGYGGGIYNVGLLDINGGTWVENQAYEGGGLANLGGGAATVNDLLVINNHADKVGGGLLNEQADLEINDSTIRENEAVRNGGGIFNWAGVVDINGTDIIKNKAGQSGGGIENTGNTVYDPGSIGGGEVTIVNSSIRKNTAGDQGGGVDNKRDSTLTITSTRFYKNTAELGGGIASTSDATFGAGSVTVSFSEFDQNSASAYGGGLYNEFSTAQLTDNDFLGNRAYEGGGLAGIGGGTVTVDLGEFRSNQADKVGGGLLNEQATLNVNDVLIASNHAVKHGGGLFNWAGTVNVDGSDFNNNSAGKSGGGIENTGNTVYDLGSVPGGVVNVSLSTFTGNIAGGFGGGIDNKRNSELNVNNSAFTNNTAQLGGAVASHSNSTFGIATVHIGASTFNSNVAAEYGGGYFGAFSHDTVSNSDFDNNRAREGAGLAAIKGGELQVSSSELTNNIASKNGGALVGEQVELIVHYSNIENNHASKNGGGIFNWAGSLQVLESDFVNNSAGQSGGGIENTGDTVYAPGSIAPGSALIEESTFTGNTAGEAGGALSNKRNSELAILHSTVSANSAKYGGGIANSGQSLFGQGEVSVYYTDVVNNDAQQYGGGLFNQYNRMIVTGEDVSDNSAYGGGGLANIEGGYVSAGDVNFSNNSADENGGGIMNELSRLIVGSSSVFDQNEALKHGGGIFNWAGEITVGRSDFTNNTAGQSGGGIENTGDTVYDPGAYPEGFATIWESTFTGNTAGDYGGAIDSKRDGRLVVTDSQFTMNSAIYGGGIAAIADTTFGPGSVEISDSTFTMNTAVEYGGGMANLLNAVTISNSDFDQNSAYSGGGLANVDEGNVTVTGGSFTNNTAGNEGGAATNEFSDLSFNGVEFTSNHADNDGGAIYNWSGQLDVEYSEFTSNSADDGGGAIETSSQRVLDPGAYPAAKTRILYSSFFGNSATYGGALRNFRDSRTVVLYSTIANNNATYGGGAVNIGITQFSGGSLKIYNSTLSGNTATSAGGGVYNNSLNNTRLINVTAALNTATIGGGFYNSSGGDFEIGNTIVAGNDAPTDDDVSGFFQSLGSNIVGELDAALGFGAAGDQLNVDYTTVIASALADNGGPTLTHALQGGSSAIDAGDNSLVSGDFDQRGFDRIENSLVDIGAIEVQV